MSAVLTETRELAGMVVTTLTLDRPRFANALDAATVEELHAGLDVAERIRADRVVFASSGRVFCGGLDLAEIDSETDATLLHRFARIELLLERIDGLPVPTVALVSGAAVGAGADLVAACSSRIGSPSSHLRFPGAGFGAVLGTARLARLTSVAFATRVTTQGQRIDATTAQLHGLLSEVLPEAEWPGWLARECELQRHCTSATYAALRKAARPAAEADALGDLVRSLVGRPGLKQRILDYRTATRSQHAPTKEEKVS